MSFKTTSEEVKDLNQVHPSQMLPILTDSPKIEQTGALRSVLGRAVFVKGDIKGKEDMQINGRVEGTISLEDNMLEIGESGHIQANAFAEVIVVSGEFIGNVYARKKVKVTKTGRVIGDIFTAEFCMEDGAHITGNVDMKKQDHFKQQHQYTPPPEVQDEIHSKNSGFGFLFKKGREVSHTEATTTIIQDLHESVTVADEIIPLSCDNNIATGCPYAERSVIGETIIIIGELLSEEDVIIHGHVDGVIYFKNNSLGVGTHSQIKGNIFVKSLVGHGEIRGEVYANEKVIIKKHGHVYGKIHSPRISTEQGSEFNGTMEMKPQNIEQTFASMGGSVTVMEKPRSQEDGDATSNPVAVKNTADERSESSHRSGSKNKDSRRPIFYPRS